MGAQHILHIFDGDFAFRLASPRNIVGNRLVVGILTIPLLVVRVEETLHVPGTRSVVHVVGIGVGAERVTRVERSGILHRQVKMVAFDELGQIGGAHVVLLLAKRIFKIKFVNAQLVRHGHIRFVRHTLGDPMMAANGFQPPDLVDVGESNAVHLIRAILLKQSAQTFHTLTGGGDVRQHESKEILFANATGDFRLIALFAFLAFGRREFHERIGTEHTLIGGERFGGAHGNVRLVHTRFAPNAFLQIGIRHSRILQRIVRKIDFNMRKHALVLARLIFRLDYDEALRAKLTICTIFITGDDGRSVITCVFANQNRGARHNYSVILSIIVNTFSSDIFLISASLYRYIAAEIKFLALLEILFHKSGFSSEENSALINDCTGSTQRTFHFVEPESLIEAGERSRGTPHMQIVVMILIWRIWTVVTHRHCGITAAALQQRRGGGRASLNRFRNHRGNRAREISRNRERVRIVEIVHRASTGRFARDQ